MTAPDGVTRPGGGTDPRGGPGSGSGPRSGGANVDDAAARLFVAMARLTRGLRRGAPSPLGPSSVSALATVVNEGAIRLGDLAAREGVRAPTMTRIVSALEAEGHLVREADPADRRACLVRASEDGTRLVQGARSARSSLLVDRINRLPDDQRAALLAALPALEALGADET